MLFLEFLWIFVFIVFLNAHPIFKSMTNKSMPHNIDIIKRNQDYNRLDNYEKHTTRYDMMKNIPFEENKNNLMFRRKIACKKTNDFDKYELPKNYENYGDAHTYKEVTSNTRTIFQSTETDALRKGLNFIDLISTTPSLLDISILENSNNFFDLSSPRSLNKDTKFLGTAEIEAILNKVKHREIQMITGHDPSLANLITNTIIQTTYSKAYSNNNKYTWPGGIKKTKNKLLNHLFQRSIKEECSTLAQNLENKLQQKIQNVYKRVKNKLSRDYNKEIENFKYAAKQKFEGITNKFCNSTTKFSQKHPSNATVANSRNTCSTKKFKPLQKNKSIYSTPFNHTISTSRDEFSIPTVIEQLLSKVQEHSVINTFTTIRNSIKKVERSSRPNQNNSSDDQDIFHVLEYPNANLDTDNKIGFLETVTNGEEQNDKSDTTTEDTSFEALSNKLSYNDYVNGYKYYLNYQKEQDDNKFSNLIRYQAHKHHNVDDIGKFILNKIPQLSTKLYKRHFVESVTLEDQDVSTKNEDSWFKRNFFIHVNTDPPKQFHSTQTVTCKNNILQYDNNNDLRNNAFWHKRYIKERDNLNDIRKHRDLFMLSKNKFNSPFNNKYITSHTRSTATVMLQKEKDRKGLRSFQKFYRKPNQKHKRESENNRNYAYNNIKEHLKTDLSHGYLKVPVTCSTLQDRTKLILPKIQKPNDMSSNIYLDNNIILKKSDPLANIKVGSNLLKDNDLADKVTEMYCNNLITTDSIHKLYEKDMQLKKYYKKSSNTILRNDYNFVGSIKSTTNSVDNKVNKSNVKDTSRNTGGKLYSMGLLKSTKFAQNMDKSLKEYRNSVYKNNYANSNANSVTNKNNNSNITFSENIKVQPKQYFMTPLPMKMEEFNKFLKDHQIDVESVTAPLKRPHPFSPSIIDKWNLKERPKSIKRDIFT